MTKPVEAFLVRSSAVSSMPDAWIVLLLTLLEEHPEATADRAIKILEACQVEEEDFFCHVTHKTWDVILHDIRKAHENDNESAPDTTPADELIWEVQKAMQSPGDRVQQFTEMFCKAFQLKYKRLSQEERSLLKRYNDEIAAQVLAALQDAHTSSVRALRSFDGMLPAPQPCADLRSLPHAREQLGALVAQKLLRMIAGAGENNAVMPWK